MLRLVPLCGHLEKSAGRTNSWEYGRPEHLARRLRHDRGRPTRQPVWGRHHWGEPKPPRAARCTSRLLGLRRRVQRLNTQHGIRTFSINVTLDRCVDTWKESPMMRPTPSSCDSWSGRGDAVGSRHLRNDGELLAGHRMRRRGGARVECCRADFVTRTDRRNNGLPGKK